HYVHSKYVVESNNSTSVEPCSINTVQEVVKKTVKRKNQSQNSYFHFILIDKLKMPLVKGRCTADRIIKWVPYHSVELPNYDQLDYPLLRFILGESRHSKYTEPFYLLLGPHIAVEPQRSNRDMMRSYANRAPRLN
ncbi:ATP-dependent DNA helicase, partial [Aphis craccivora]